MIRLYFARYRLTALCVSSRSLCLATVTVPLRLSHPISTTDCCGQNVATEFDGNSLCVEMPLE